AHGTAFPYPTLFRSEIDRQVYPRPWSLSLYQGELAMPANRRVYLVARIGRRVVGHAGLTYAADEGHVTTVAVDPAWQGRGVGARSEEHTSELQSREN